MKKTIAILMLPLFVLFLSSCAPSPPKEGRLSLTSVMTRLSLYCDCKGVPVCAATPLDLWNFYGIDAADTVQYQTKSFAGDGENTEILLFEAKDKASLAKIRMALQKRLDIKLKKLRQESPAQYAFYRESRVVSNGRYIRLIFPRTRGVFPASTTIASTHRKNNNNRGKDSA